MTGELKITEAEYLNSRELISIEAYSKVGLVNKRFYDPN